MSICHPPAISVGLISVLIGIVVALRTSHQRRHRLLCPSLLFITARDYRSTFRSFGVTMPPRSLAISLYVYPPYYLPLNLTIIPLNLSLGRAWSDLLFNLQSQIYFCSLQTAWRAYICATRCSWCVAHSSVEPVSTMKYLGKKSVMRLVWSFLRHHESDMNSSKA
jgi:hypothetical protein